MKILNIRKSNITEERVTVPEFEIVSNWTITITKLEKLRRNLIATNQSIRAIRVIRTSLPPLLDEAQASPITAKDLLGR
jgi:hypothetical protein